MVAVLSTSMFVACNKDDDNNSDNNELISESEYAVSLGLPSGTKWAKINIGATNPWNSGDYFAWGETTPKETYNWSTYLHKAAGQTEEGEEWKLINKYQVVDGARGIWYTDIKFVGDNKTTLDPEDDAAIVNWGGDWVTPSRVDFIELRNFCEVVQTDDYKGTGVAGVIYKANGKEAFFPNAGYKFMDIVCQDKSVGPLWANSIMDTHSAFKVWTMESQVDELVDGYERFMGLGVRPVCKAGGNTNGHEAVDFGLPSGKLWATMNVGAQKAEDHGYYLAWGETEPKETYCDSTYKYAIEGDPGFAYSYTKYQVEDSCLGGKWYSKVFVGDGKATIEDIDDAAVVNWGGKWKMPTIEQIEELFEECYWLWTNNYADTTNVSGYIVFKVKDKLDKGIKVYNGKPKLPKYTLKDNHIFLPSAGIYVGNIKFGGSVRCWAATIEDTDAAHMLSIDSDDPYPWISQEFRMYGLPIRPVLNK